MAIFYQLKGVPDDEAAKIADYLAARPEQFLRALAAEKLNLTEEALSNPITSDLSATYVIVNADRHGHRLVHRRVSYDHAAVLERLRRSSHPQAGFIAAFQQGKHVRHPADRPGAPIFTS